MRVPPPSSKAASGPAAIGPPGRDAGAATADSSETSRPAKQAPARQGPAAGVAVPAGRGPGRPTGAGSPAAAGPRKLVPAQADLCETRASGRQAQSEKLGGLAAGPDASTAPASSHRSGNLFSRLLNIGSGRSLRELQKVSAQVAEFEPAMRALSDAQLKAKTVEFKQRLASGESLDAMMPEAYAVVREAGRRTLGLRPFDEQVMGGVALHEGQIAEMQTGEGKTIAAAMPVYLNALEGKGVHVFTTNDYLATRDAEKMGRVYRFLGLSVGSLRNELGPEERKAAYAADITYGTPTEFGFDFLRDARAGDLSEVVQRGLHYALIDEVDSILCDEARTRLIMSGKGDVSSEVYGRFRELADELEPERDYEVDEEQRLVTITDEGIAYAEELLGIDNLYSEQNAWQVPLLYNALQAKEIFKLDRDYVVRPEASGGPPRVLIVDEYTGRVMQGRRFESGLHQALEAKERVEIQPESKVEAAISLQSLVRAYGKHAGMTGTASSEEKEFRDTYGMSVVSIPTHNPPQRIDQPDLVYRTEEAKFQAVVRDVAERYRKGQPVLIGTTSVENSKRLSRLLFEARVPHRTLNARHPEAEAGIVAEAGRKGAVTVATNMAGRGTDIMLGGNPEFRADAELKKRKLDPTRTPDEYEAAWPQALKEAKEQVAAEHEEVLALGGLYVIGTERHESRRIDDQLRGRSGRQGDPGETRFYLSLQDPVAKRFNGSLVEKLFKLSGGGDDAPLDPKLVGGALEIAQGYAEAEGAEQRKQVLDYDAVLDRQREVLFKDRRRILEGEDLRPQVMAMIDDVVAAMVREATGGHRSADRWDLDALGAALSNLCATEVRPQEIVASLGGRRPSAEALTEALRAQVQAAYVRRQEDLDARFGEGFTAGLERKALLGVVDDQWEDHLQALEGLKDGIGWRTLVGEDPVVSYRHEGYELFDELKTNIKANAVGFLFNADVT